MYQIKESKQTESVAGKPMTVAVIRTLKPARWGVAREMYGEWTIVKTTPTKKAALAYMEATY